MELHTGIVDSIGQTRALRLCHLLFHPPSDIFRNTPTIYISYARPRLPPSSSTVPIPPATAHPPLPLCPQPECSRTVFQSPCTQACSPSALDPSARKEYANPDHRSYALGPRYVAYPTPPTSSLTQVRSGRTRFAQARAELGMTDRTGGPSALNYTHRRRPENYEEDEDENSEGEDVVKLKGSTNQPSGDDEDRRLDARDLALARTLRVRAEGLEKVVTAMLGQPPPVPMDHDDDPLTPPTSPKTNSTPSAVPAPHYHTLPNGVRLRLALGTIINDLFARQAPNPPYRHQFDPSRTPSELSPPDSSAHTCNIDGIPQALSSLSTVCAACSGSIPSYSRSPELQSSSSSTLTGYPVSISIITALQIFNILLQSHGYQQPHFTPSSRSLTLYKAGADPNTDHSLPGFCCPRHLEVGCEICVCAKTPTRSVTGPNRGRPISGSNTRYAPNNNPWKGSPGGVGPGGGGTSGWQVGIGIGAGLLRPGVHGNVLRRKVHHDGESDEAASSSSGAGNTKLSSLIPRFIRLSALVAVELALEAQDEEEARAAKSGGFTPPMSPSTPRMSPLSSRSQDRSFDTALLPTREWYLLLAGLLTRAVLEGYLTAGWRGLDPVRCLLTVGLGMAEGNDRDEPLSGFEEFDPDGLPTLREAMKVLFPSSKSRPSPGKCQAEEEYEIEMRERMRMVRIIR